MKFTPILIVLYAINIDLNLYSAYTRYSGSSSGSGTFSLVIAFVWLCALLFVWRGSQFLDKVKYL